MSFLKNSIDLYISSSIHVSLAVVSLSVITFLEFGMAPDYDLLFFIFFGTITGYNFVKYAGIAKLKHLSLTRNLRIIQVFSLFCFLAEIYFFLIQSIEVIVLAIVLGLFTLFYAVPFLGRKRNLRSLSGIKIFVIALSWAGATVLLPAMTSMDFLLWDVVVEFLQRLLLVVVLMLPFEIRDLKYDLAALSTLPQQIGVKRTKILGYALLSIILVLEFFQENFMWINFLTLGLTLFILGGFLLKSKIDQHPYFASLWVESVPVIWLVVLLLLRNFV
ncbi:hypothetical protein RM549_05415 [Salegentibacter sp. F188]|uniref:Prenyltransferase n=1 Tax=Autumnicola patrickiae TaxID=3075591 RepID=A0ABU3DZP1_9FLAO|nr:hypothetical protein [Salegentibacter sp. F188]MDT0689213.1 hypothetical protein [Salegentibacter sp. F188]